MAAASPFGIAPISDLTSLHSSPPSPPQDVLQRQKHMDMGIRRNRSPIPDQMNSIGVTDKPFVLNMESDNPYGNERSITLQTVTLVERLLELVSRCEPISKQRTIIRQLS